MNRISVMYFDKAHELGLHFWIFLYLAQHQLSLMKMWYIFMGTKLSISYYAPCPNKCQSSALLACTCLTKEIVLSLWLKAELAQLLPPYIDLGFDQWMIAKGGVQVSVCLGDMQTIKFLSQYGRQMYIDLTCKPQLLISLPGGVHIYLKKHWVRWSLWPPGSNVPYILKKDIITKILNTFIKLYTSHILWVYVTKEKTK